MRWQNNEESDNVEDRRGQQSARLRGVPVKGKSGVILLVVVLVAGYYGIDLTPLLSGGSMPSASVNAPYTPTVREQESARFSSVTLKMTEDAWAQIFSKAGRTYVPPKLVLYTGATQTTCGYGQAAMGPFYCPGDQNVYLDLSFFEDMRTRLGGGGDFAQAYVIAHEVGHHVQHLLGTDQHVQQLQRRNPDKANQLSVRMELQADCYAGVWGNMAQRKGVLEAGDLERALRTAEAIGDDRLQKQSSGRVVPDSFTHGTSRQRYTWFKRGFDSGDPKVCDTFQNAD